MTAFVRWMIRIRVSRELGLSLYSFLQIRSIRDVVGGHADAFLVELEPIGFLPADEAGQTRSSDGREGTVVRGASAGALAIRAYSEVRRNAGLYGGFKFQ